MKSFDIAIVGGGPGGYVAAIKAGQLGKSVVCIDKGSKLGGTCLNVGCIPSKALLNITHKYSDIKSVAQYGIQCDNVSFSLEKIMSYKNQTISDLDLGIKSLFKKNKVEYINSTGSFINHNTIVLEDGSQITASNIIIATGSNPASLPNVSIDEKQILSSTGALCLTTVPKKMVIIGAGVIGLEMGSIWSRLGSEVIIIEYANSVLSGSDTDISETVQKILTKQGMSFIMSAQVIGVDDHSVSYKQDNQNFSISDIDAVLIAIGRKPNTDKLGLDKIGVKVNNKGQIEVNEHLQTTISNIYAIGDVIDGPMLAHKASEEGVAVVDYICGNRMHINYNIIPNIIYTSPEIAIIGKTEKQLIDNKMQYKVGKFAFTANSRAKAIGESDGFVKVLVNLQDEIIGAAIINQVAGEMIHEIAVAMEFRASSQDIGMITHGHPTMSEAIKEAMLSAYSKPIHS